jgi:enoyl-CoA hydratase/carnithine racemase
VKLSTVELHLADNGLSAHIVVPGGPLEAVTARELAEAATGLSEDRSIRAVTIRSASEPFCSGPGADLEPTHLRPDPASAIATIRVPVIVGVNGACRGVGLEIALAADIIVGASDSVYALDHILAGQVPAWGGSQRLPRAIGSGPAMAHALLGTDIAGPEAVSLGLVYQLSDDLDGVIDAMVGTLSARGPLALEFTKEAVHRGSELPLRDGLRLEGDLNHQLAATEDRAEGLQAFFDKRPPDFSGR